MFETQLQIHDINKSLLSLLTVLGSLGVTHQILLVLRRSLLVVVSPILQAHALLTVTIADIHHLLIDSIHVFLLENLGSRSKLLAHFLHHVFKIVHTSLDSQISILSHCTHQLRQYFQLSRVKTDERSRHFILAGILEHIPEVINLLVGSRYCCIVSFLLRLLWLFCFTLLLLLEPFCSILESFHWVSGWFSFRSFNLWFSLQSLAFSIDAFVDSTVQIVCHFTVQIVQSHILG